MADMNVKKIAIDEIEKTASIACDVNDKIWEYAELSLKEFKSTELYCKVLEENGFTVEGNLAGIKTCFKGSYGSGRPYIGILAEFDALGALSQECGKTEKSPLVKDGCGHGCGHNILGAGSLSAVLGIKKYLEETKTPGTVIFYGCPGEEGGAGKAFMARDNMWAELDMALTWHPNSANKIFSESCIACIQKEYTFKGLSSHAAGNPEKGRSALDAVELMNVGVQFLREHMNSSARIHYAITNGGGLSPNVVQPIAKVLYMVRDTQVNDAIALQARVDKIAQGAAMMTETTVSTQFIDGTANVIQNDTLAQQLYDNFVQVELPTYTDEEIAFAQGLVDSYEIKPTPLADTVAKMHPELYDEIDKLTNHGTKPLNGDFVVPFKPTNFCLAGSTDVGDVSWQTPTSQVNTACFAANSPGHSWQNVSIGATSIAHKGLLLAGKVMAMTAIDCFEDHSIIERATEEFKKRTVAGYTCPIEADAVPVAIE